MQQEFLLHSFLLVLFHQVHKIKRGGSGRSSDFEVMNMKVYIYNGRRYWFEEGKEPEGAVLEQTATKAAETPKNKAVTPQNKARKASKK